MLLALQTMTLTHQKTIRIAPSSISSRENIPIYPKKKFFIFLIIKVFIDFHNNVFSPTISYITTGF